MELARWTKLQASLAVDTGGLFRCPDPRDEAAEVRGGSVRRPLPTLAEREALGKACERWTAAVESLTRAEVAVAFYPNEETEETVNEARLAAAVFGDEIKRQWMDFRAAFMVSVVCPTVRRRRGFHGLVWDCFCRQTHTERELIVIETGVGGPSDFWLELARKDKRLVYRHFDVPEDAWTVGLKRNIAGSLARGNVIAHFDDDDVYAPNYLEFMIERLATPRNEQLIQKSSCAAGVAEAMSGSGAACAKLGCWLKFNLNLDVWGVCNARDYTLRADAEESVDKFIYGWGFTLVYLRSAWLMSPFPNKQLGEDHDFVKGLLQLGMPLALVQDPDAWGVCVHTSHGGNTSGRLGELSRPLQGGKASLAKAKVAPLLGHYGEVARRLREERKA